jgi:sigma-E factor negative regulatory protein RseA
MSTDSEQQRVSCLMDGEAGRFEAAAAINDLLRSPELAGCWERWHLIGRALRHEPSDFAVRATAEHVRAALEDPATQPLRPSDDAAASSRRGRRLLTPLGGAVAAGVALLGVALLLSPSVRQQAITEQAFTAAEVRWQQPDPVVRARLDRLLFNHHEQMAGPGRTGVGAYAAVIGYERLP